MSKIDSKKSINISNTKDISKNETENKELVEFFEEVQKEKEKLEAKEEELKETPKEKIKEEKPKINNEIKEPKLKVFMLVISFVAALTYYIVYIKSVFNSIEYVRNIINASLLILLFLFIVIALLSNKKIKNIFTILISLLVICLVSTNILIINNKLVLPTNEVLKNFINTSLTDAMKYASEKGIKLSSLYEYSDNTEEGYIISQDVSEGTILKNVKELNIVVSNGPSLDKELILSNWIGRELNDLIEYINTNHLSNVDINFETNNDNEKDIIISQSTKGEIKRNTNISFTVSLGNENSLKDITIEDLTNKKLFDATLYLKRNAIKYELEYSYSDSIKNGYIIIQSIKKGTKVSPNNETIKLTVSKGKEITVPDFKDKTLDDVIDWITSNNLKIAFSESYHTTIPEGELIGINYNVGDKIDEGTKIIVTTSKGGLKVPDTTNLNEFRSWASENGVSYNEQYEYNDNVGKGKIISLSIKAGTVIDVTKDNITVKVSYGSPVSVPNFTGKSKSTIQSECSRIGLNCTFSYAGYNSAAKDTALYQNIAVGRQVVSGTYINITLSSGPAQTFNIFIQSEWFGSSADATITTLRSKLSSSAPGVNFNYVKKAANSCIPGVIHPDSPVKAGNNNFTQGNTYTIWVMDC